MCQLPASFVTDFSHATLKTWKGLGTWLDDEEWIGLFYDEARENGEHVFIKETDRLPA